MNGKVGACLCTFKIIFCFGLGLFMFFLSSCFVSSFFFVQMLRDNYGLLLFHGFLLVLLLVTIIIIKKLVFSLFSLLFPLKNSTSLSPQYCGTRPMKIRKSNFSDRQFHGADRKTVVCWGCMDEKDHVTTIRHIIYALGGWQWYVEGGSMLGKVLPYSFFTHFNFHSAPPRKSVWRFGPLSLARLWCLM